MKYIRLHTTDPYLNLAIEEYLLTHTDDDVFMLWQNRPTVVIGKNQNAYVEVNLAYAEEAGITVSRRITGGGAVYHDLGNVNYTFITSVDRARALDYAYFTRPIIDALADLGLVCQLSGRNDLLCEGRKFSGNAQYCSGGRILHHGTLLFDSDTEIMQRVLKINREKLEYHAVKSHQSRVVNLRTLMSEPIGTEDFIAAIERKVAASAEHTIPPSGEEIDRLRARNASAAWICAEKRYLTDYTVYRQKKYPFGMVKAEIKLNKNQIEGIVLSGDFFGSSPIETLESMLIGQDIGCLSPIDPTPYIDGMTFDDLRFLLTGE
ncbi:MAG: lipoate--protein ligase [Clostridia bacterium]|nr:lipoate--protein ligase [Clostridia bacterium]